MKLMNEDFSYNYMAFYGKGNVIFKMISSRMEKINSRIENTIDEFRTDKGTYVEFKRIEILEQIKAGNMKPVLETEIIAKTYSKKEWDKKTNGVDR